MTWTASEHFETPSIAQDGPFKLFICELGFFGYFGTVAITGPSIGEYCNNSVLCAKLQTLERLVQRAFRAVWAKHGLITSNTYQLVDVVRGIETRFIFPRFMNNQELDPSFPNSFVLPAPGNPSSQNKFPADEFIAAIQAAREASEPSQEPSAPAFSPYCFGCKDKVPDWTTADHVVYSSENCHALVHPLAPSSWRLLNVDAHWCHYSDVSLTVFQETCRVLAALCELASDQATPERPFVELRQLGLNSFNNLVRARQALSVKDKLLGLKRSINSDESEVERIQKSVSLLESVIASVPHVTRDGQLASQTVLSEEYRSILESELPVVFEALEEHQVLANELGVDMGHLHFHVSLHTVSGPNLRPDFGENSTKKKVVSLEERSKIITKHQNHISNYFENVAQLQAGTMSERNENETG